MERGRITIWTAAAALLGALAIGLLLYMNVVIGPQVRALVDLPIPDFRLEGYEAVDAAAFSTALSASPEAADLMRYMHLGPDMVFPAAFCILALMVLVRHAPRALVFHRPITRLGIALVLAAPVFYAIADYAENIISLMLFPPATPDPQNTVLSFSLLAVLTRTKFMLFFITLILMARFTLFREKPKAE